MSWIQRMNCAICLAERMEHMLPISLSRSSFLPDTSCPSLRREERKGGEKR